MRLIPVLEIPAPIMRNNHLLNPMFFPTSHVSFDITNDYFSSIANIANAIIIPTCTGNRANIIYGIELADNRCMLQRFRSRHKIVDRGAFDKTLIGDMVERYLITDFKAPTMCLLLELLSRKSKIALITAEYEWALMFSARDAGDN
jgi:hypothetical protein